uniref:Uncharacterized protein n=1 Tax=Panagrolaimus sp. JU765 TaxID=591449 RepID=A0AC34QVZ7_9BILA
MSKVTPEAPVNIKDAPKVPKKVGKFAWTRRKDGGKRRGGTVDGQSVNENQGNSKSSDIPNNPDVKTPQSSNQKPPIQKKKAKSTAKNQKSLDSSSKAKVPESTEVPISEVEAAVKSLSLKEEQTSEDKPKSSDSHSSQQIENGKEQKAPVPKQKKPKPKKSKKPKVENQSVSDNLQYNDLEGSSKSIPSQIEENKPETEKPSKKSSVKQCMYFTRLGYCYFGNKCHFLHTPVVKKENPKKETKPLKEKTSEKAEVILPAKAGKFEQIKPAKVVFKAADVGTEKQQAALKKEISYFQRRFDGTVVTEMPDGTLVKFEYTSTNPEWAFDVKTITLTLELKPEHPISMVNVDVEQGQMPDALHQYLKKKLNEMLQSLYEDSVRSDAFDLIGKWFVAQLNHHLLELFVVGLKRTKWLLNAAASGIKLTVFDAPEKVEERKLTTIELISKQEKQKSEKTTVESEDVQPSVETDSDGIVAEVSSSQVSTPAVKIQICFNWQDLEQTIGTVSLVHFSGAARCLRCATQEFFEVSDGKEKTWLCKKCSSKQSIDLESVIGHQNSNVFGNCHPVGCRPVDLILQSSKLKMTCFNCSKELVVEALPYGASFKTWCRKCNMKLDLMVDSATFRGNFTAIPQGELVKGAKAPKAKAVKDAFIITPGQPLPKNGTCNHYGKSFRWFRFPCCGKLYACDLCHNEAELDHEMKLANRMICGFCSTEQPFSKDSCSICKGAVTKIRSTFWEGGKGCRDQKTMCRNDPKKYKNASKTIPKKRTGQTSNKKGS